MNVFVHKWVSASVSIKHIALYIVNEARKDEASFYHFFLSLDMGLMRSREISIEIVLLHVSFIEIAGTITSLLVCCFYLKTLPNFIAFKR